MPRRGTGNENIRQVQVTGRDGGSYMITLPKEYVQKLGWRENQKVVVELDEDSGQLVVKDWQE